MNRKILCNRTLCKLNPWSGSCWRISLL